MTKKKEYDILGLERVTTIVQMLPSITVYHCAFSLTLTQTSQSQSVLRLREGYLKE